MVSGTPDRVILNGEKVSGTSDRLNRNGEVVSGTPDRAILNGERVSGSVKLLKIRMTICFILRNQLPLRRL